MLAPPFCESHETDRVHGEGVAQRVQPGSGDFVMFTWTKSGSWDTVQRKTAEHCVRSPGQRVVEAEPRRAFQREPDEHDAQPLCMQTD